MDGNNREELYSKAVRAGKRTYFFDVKTTRGNDLYLTITESKKRYDKDGSGKFFYEKHKLFLYKEDFDKFAEGLTESIDKIAELRATGDFKEDTDPSEYTAPSQPVPEIAAEPADEPVSESNEPVNEEDAPMETAESIMSDESADPEPTSSESNQFTDVSFEDLGSEERTGE